MWRWRLGLAGLMVLGLFGWVQAQVPAGYRVTSGILAPFGGAYFTDAHGLKNNTIVGTYFSDHVSAPISFEVSLTPRSGQASTLSKWKAIPLRELNKASGNGLRTGWYWSEHFALGIVQSGYLESPGMDEPFVPILVPDSCGTVGASVNDDGWLVGDWDRCNGSFRSFLRRPDGELLLIDGPWPDVLTFQLTDISDIMDVVGGVAEGWAFLGLAVAVGQWEWVRLDAPGAVWTFAQGLNNKRQVVGTFARADGICRGFLYTHGAAAPWKEFALPGSGCTIIKDINDAGRMVGIHDIATGQWRAHVIEPQ